MIAKSRGFKPVPQVHPMGCAVACVASRCGISYEAALELFAIPSHAWERGYYCQEIVDALTGAGFEYCFSEYVSRLHRRILREPGTIIFVESCEQYRAGHFLLRGRTRWVNSWVNAPCMIPVRGGFQEGLPGRPSYVIFEVGGVGG